MATEPDPKALAKLSEADRYVRERLREMRRSAELEQKDVGAYLGHSQRWVSGREHPDPAPGNRGDITWAEAIVVAEKCGWRLDVSRAGTPAMAQVLDAYTRLSKPEDRADAYRLVVAIADIQGSHREILRSVLKAIEKREAV